jgi:mono/diheme cytochrome c family protein
VAPPPPAGPPLSYELRLGKQVFQHYCLTCHGESGAGDGFNAFNVEPHPRDLSDPAFQKAKTDADLTDTIRRGGVGVGLSPLMPPWGKTLTPDQIDQVVGYLRTLKRTDAPPSS